MKGGYLAKVHLERGYLANTINSYILARGYLVLLKGYLDLGIWPGAIWFFEGLFGQGLFGMTSH